MQLILIVLLVLSIMALPFVLSMLFFSAKESIVAMRRTRLQNKMYLEGEKRVKEMKKNGDIHEWVEINIAGKSLLVCKKTGYVPSQEGFLTPDMVELKLVAKELDDLEQSKFLEIQERLTKEEAALLGITMQNIEDLLTFFKKLPDLAWEEIANSEEHKVLRERFKQLQEKVSKAYESKKR